jgi:hypothetical protein
MSSREFSVRVSEELAHWVRQCGPAKEVIGRIATAARRGLIDADGRDPGPGPERLTVRVPNHALPVIRKLTHSRDNLVALRKLILVGYQARALPAMNVALGPLASAPIQSNQVLPGSVHPSPVSPSTLKETLPQPY